MRVFGDPEDLLGLNYLTMGLRYTVLNIRLSPSCLQLELSTATRTTGDLNETILVSNHMGINLGMRRSTVRMHESAQAIHAVSHADRSPHKQPLIT